MAKGVTVICYTLKKEMKCNGDFEILREIFRDTARKSEKHELFRVVSPNPCNNSFPFQQCTYSLDSN